MKIHETLGEDLQGFASLLESICETLGDFGRGFTRILRFWETLEEDS